MIGRKTAQCSLAVLVVASSVVSTAQARPRRPEGVSAEIEASIRRGAEYLVRTQNADGSWNNMGGWGRYPTAMTALAGTALLATGSTASRGPRAPAIRKAADFLIHAASTVHTGLIATPDERGRSMHGHGYAMLFLAEVFGNQKQARRQQQLHDTLVRAVRLTERSQSRAGGWLYTPEQDADEGSVTVTQIQALRAARNAGIFVNPATIRRAVKYLEQSANPDGGIRYSLLSSWGSRPAITAAAVATLYNAGEYDSPLAAKCLAYCDRNIAVDSGRGWGVWGHYYYTHLYLAQAKYQQGGEDWKRYYRAISRKLLGMQKSDGSWLGDGVGSSYGTAIALTVLQLPYQYVSTYQR